MTLIKNIGLSLMVSSAVLLSSFQSVQAAAVVYHQNDVVPTGFIVHGCDEDLWMSGDIHTNFSVVFNSAGGYQLTSTANPQGVTAIGLQSQLVYRGTGVSMVKSTVGNLGNFEVSYLNNFNFVAPGPNNNLMVHSFFHGTITPNGDLTAYNFDSWQSCR